MNRFKQLIVWQRSIELAKMIYEATKTFPTSETYGLASQMKRCSISIASNIAEGAGRNSNKEFIYFLSISQGSIHELETQLIISKQFNYINSTDAVKLDKHVLSIQNMLYSLQQTLRLKDINSKMN